MATNENLIPIPGRLHSVASDEIVSGANEIYDDKLSDNLENLNTGFTNDIDTIYNTIGDNNEKGAIMEQLNTIDGRLDTIDGEISALNHIPIEVVPLNPSTGEPNVSNPEGNILYRAFNSDQTSYSDWMYKEDDHEWVKIFEQQTPSELEKLVGYYTCSTAANLPEKSVGDAGYILPANGGAMKIKMTKANTAANATLKIGTETAKPLFYNGERANATNSWDDNEVISVYYDGTNYQASNAQGSSSRKINSYLLGDLRLLAIGQTYKVDEPVKTTDKQFLKISKPINLINLVDTVSIGDLVAYSSATYEAKQNVTIYNKDTEYVSGDCAFGSQTVITITIDTSSATIEEEATITITIGSVSKDIIVTSESTAAYIASKIVEDLSINGWSIVDNEDGTITITCNTGGINTLDSSVDTGETGISITSNTVLGDANLKVYDGVSWTNATNATYVASNVWDSTGIDEAYLIANATVQNTLASDINVSDGGVYKFQAGSLNESTGAQESGTSGYYIRTIDAIPIKKDTSMYIVLSYKDSGGSNVTGVTSLLFKYLDSTFIGTQSVPSVLTCDGSFNSFKIRGMKNSLSGKAAYCSVTVHYYRNLQTLKEDVYDARERIETLEDTTLKREELNLNYTFFFEQGQIDDSGKDSTASASYYIRTPASSPIPIINGQTMNLTFIYKNSSGTTITPDNTRIYKYLDGVYVSRVQTTAKTAVVECDGTFNQLRIRAFRNGIGSLYSYCSVKYLVEKTLRDVAEQVDTNTADIASITANLQDVSTTVESMEGQTINKRQYTSSDLGSSYYVLDNPYQTTGSYSIYGGIKVPVKRGDHITLYTIGSSGAAKCWGLVDEYRKILSRSSGTNYLTNPAEIDVTRDCYLCANVATTKAAEKAQFKLIITSNVQAQIEGAVSDLNALIKRAPQFCNNPFPFKGETLKVLSLGNSFAEDTSAHLEGMMNAAGLDKSKFCYYFTFKSGATLQQYASNYVSGELYNCIDKNGSYTTTPRAGTYSMPNSSGSLKKIVSQDWDLILLQQASTDAYEWSSYIPYITRLVNYIKRDCPKACIGFMLTWATTYTGTTHAPSYAQRYEMNVNCAKKVLHEIGIDFIVAPGTAIQNARNTSLEDSDHLLRDSRHLNTGIGRYVAGCAFFDAVIAPFYGVSIIGNSYTTSAGTPVTDDNKLLCQQCGHAAVANMFEVTTGIDPTYTITFKDGSTTISTTTGFTGTAVDIPVNPEKEGYIFSGWSTDGTTVVTPNSKIGIANVTYVAVWEQS